MRKIGAAILVVLAAVLLLLTSYGWWANNYFLDSKQFSHKATQIVERPAVQQALAVAITDEITKRSGRDVHLAEPFITSIVEKIVDTAAFNKLFDNSVLRLHRAIVGGRARAAVLDLSNTVDRVKNALDPIAPNLAARIPSGKQVEVELLTKSQLQTVYDTTHLVEQIVIALTIATIVCFAGALALSPRRWRTLALGGWVTLGLFVVSLVLVRTGRSVIGSIPNRAEYSNAAQSAYKVVTRGLVVQGVVFAVLGLLVALGAGWTDRHGGWAAVTATAGRGTAWARAHVPRRQPVAVPTEAPAGVPATAATAAAAAPGAHTGVVAGALAPRLPPPVHHIRTAHWWRAAGLLVVGLFAVFSPTSLTTLVVVLLGLVALYLAVTEALAAWGSPHEHPPGGAADTADTG